MDSVAEIWRDVVGHEGYEVSNLGRIRSVDRWHICRGGRRQIRGKVLCQQIDRDGYLCVTLSQSTPRKKFFLRSHRLVATAFLGCQDETKQINHIDGDKKNNTPENLEWVTPAENIHHSVVNGMHGASKLTVDEVREIRRI